jgi:acyl-CoA synthetase (AMP-forming)/AMP-acid ligase II
MLLRLIGADYSQVSRGVNARDDDRQIFALKSCHGRRPGQTMRWSSRLPVELPEMPHASRMPAEDAVYGLNQDFPLLLSSVLEHGAMNFGDVQIVSVNRDEHARLDYRVSASRAHRLASSLRRLGFGPDVMVGSLAWNSHRHFELFYGVTGLGSVLHTANPRLPPAQICYTINFSGYHTLFVDLDTIALAESLAPRLKTIKRYVVMATRDTIPVTNLPDVVCYEDLIDAGDPDFAWPTLDERTACLLCFTSGTTGDPKGALYSHRGTVLSTMSTGAGNGWGLSADDAILGIPGFFHCNGWAVPFFGPMYGAKLVLPGRRADTEWLHKLIVEEGITAGPGVPTVWLSMLEYCREHGLSLGRLNRIYSGGTAPPAAMIEAYFREFGVRTIHGWGMTETTSGATISFAPATLLDDDALAVMRTPGKPLYGNEIRIVDDNDLTLPRDGKTPGHLQARGAWISGAYYRRSDVDAVTSDGWLRTGDVATIEPDNTLHIVDRAKDVIKSGGEWISSQALEDATCRHPAVAEAAVVSIPHPRWQERPFLIVLPRTPVTADELRTHLADLVPKWWLPDAIAFVDELPHGPTGKIAKNVLRAWIAQGKLVP